MTGRSIVLLVFLAAISAITACSPQWRTALYASEKIERPEWLDGVWLPQNGSQSAIAFRNFGGQETTILVADDYITSAPVIYTQHNGRVFLNIDTRRVKTALGQQVSFLGEAKGSGFFVFVVENVDSDELILQQAINPEKLQAALPASVKYTCERPRLSQNSDANAILAAINAACLLVDTKSVEKMSDDEVRRLVGPEVLRLRRAS